MNHFGIIISCGRSSLVACALVACNGELDLTDDTVGGSGGGNTNIGGGDTAGGDTGGSTGSGDTGGSDVPGGGSNGDGAGATCDDRVQNGDEAGVDCGGSACEPCVPCSCASSDGLQALGCGVEPNAGAITGNTGTPTYVSAAGDTVAFDWCYADGVCRGYSWTLAGGIRELEAPGGASVTGLTADGSRVLVSSRLEFGGEALLIDAEGQSTPTGLRSRPVALSRDGVVVGMAPAAQNPTALMRRTLAGQLEELGDLPYAMPESFVVFGGVTDGATAIAGFAYTDERREPFRWTEAGGLVLGVELPSNADGASVSALSADGSTFSGTTFLGQDPVSVFRWTQASGLVEVTPAVSSAVDFGYTLTALDTTGELLAATSGDGTDFGAIHWTQASGVTRLTPGAQSQFLLMTRDGSVTVASTGSGRYSTFVLRRGAAPESVGVLLEAAGASFDGWQLGPPLASSDDGRVLVGTGRCGGTDVVYRLTMPE